MRHASITRLAWAVFIAAIALLGAFVPVYWVYLLTTVAVSALIARSIGLVTNQAGIMVLCQMSFAAIGGWVVSWIAIHWPTVPFPLMLLVAGVAAAPVGWLLGLVTARIRGVELAVVTLGFAAALDLVLRQGAFPGVGAGTPVIPAAPFDDPRWFFGLAWVLTLALQAAVWLLSRTRHGLGWAAVRGSERAAAALGVRVAGAKASAVGVGAGLAGVAGGLLAGQYGLLTPQVFSPLTSLVVLATAVLMGASLFSGAVLAGVVAVFVPEGLRRLGLPLDIGNALLALGAVDVLRRGTGGIAEQGRAAWQARVFRGVRRTCDLQVAEGAAARAEAGAVAAEGPDARAIHLEATDVTVRAGDRVLLDAVTLAVHGGGVHALVGANGAGKTTLIDALTGFVPVASGTVRLGGAEGDEPRVLDRLSASARARAGLCRTFQQQRLAESLTVGEYLRLSSGPAGGGSEGAALIHRVTNEFGLPEPGLPVRLMDAGSRRLLEIAGAVAAAPRVLLLDEPAAGFGEIDRRALATLLRRLPERFGCAVLLVEHDMELVREVATVTTVLDEGRVIASGHTATVLGDPRVVAAYLGRVA